MCIPGINIKMPDKNPNKKFLKSFAYKFYEMDNQERC